MKSSHSKSVTRRRTTKLESSDDDKPHRGKDTRVKSKQSRRVRESKLESSIGDYGEFENCHEMGQTFINDEEHRYSDHLNDMAHGFVGPDHSGYTYEDHSDYSPDELEASGRNSSSDRKVTTWGGTQLSEKSDVDSSKYQSEFDSDS